MSPTERWAHRSLLFTSFLASPAFGACPATVSAVELSQFVGDAEAAWTALDSQGLMDSVSQTRDAIPCVRESLTAPDVAAYFRVVGLSWFALQNQDRAALAFRAASAIQPTYQFTNTLAPVGHPMRTSYEQASALGTSETTLLPSPAEGHLQIDGRRNQMVPTDRPYLWQRFHADGTVADTAVVQPTQRPPAYAEELPVSLPTPGHPSTALAIAGGTAVVAGVISMVLANETRLSYRAGNGETEALETQNAALGWTGIALTSVGAGLGVGAIAVGNW